MICKMPHSNLCIPIYRMHSFLSQTERLCGTNLYQNHLTLCYYCQTGQVIENSTTAHDFVVAYGDQSLKITNIQSKYVRV